MPPAQPCPSPLLLLLLLACQPQAPSAQVMDFLLEKWKLYGDQCLHNLSLLPPPTELVCNRTFDKYSCWPDTPPNTTARISCPWYLPWYHKVQHGFVYKRCGPDGQWVRGPQGQPLRNASQCQMDEDEVKVQKEAAKLYGASQVMYTVGYCLSLGALLLALAILLGLRRLHCTRNYIHANLFVSFVLRASSVLATDALLRTRYSQQIGDDLSVRSWLSGGALAGCRVAAVFMQYGVVANYCWLLVEGLYLHSLLGLAAGPERSLFALYVGVGWGTPMLFVVPWAVVKCLFENVQCWTSNDNMAFWWIPRLPVFLAILINFFIFIRILHILLAKLRAHQMRRNDYKFRLAKSTLTLIPLLGVHEVVFAFVTDEHAQGALRFAKLFFDLFLSSFQVPPAPGAAPSPRAALTTPLCRACWWLSSTASSIRRCRQSCCGAGAVGAWARLFGRNSGAAAARPRPGPPAEAPPRSCCSPGAGPAAGPARIPLQGPTRPSASPGWPTAPSEALRAPPGAGLRSRKSSNKQFRPQPTLPESGGAGGAPGRWVPSV